MFLKASKCLKWKLAILENLKSEVYFRNVTLFCLLFKNIDVLYTAFDACSENLQWSYRENQGNTLKHLALCRKCLIVTIRTSFFFNFESRSAFINNYIFIHSLAFGGQVQTFDSFYCSIRKKNFILISRLHFYYSFGRKAMEVQKGIYFEDINLHTAEEKYTLGIKWIKLSDTDAFS